MNITRLDRWSCGLAATVLIVGFGGAAQAQTATDAASLLDPATEGAIVAQTNEPTPLDSPGQLPPPGEPVPQQPGQPGRPAAPPRPTPEPRPGIESAPLDAPGQLPPPGESLPDETIEPAPVPTRPAPPPRTQSDIRPGRATRSGPSYIGIGGNIGLGDGGTSLGDTSFAVISKIGLTRLFSIRPSVLFSDDVTILLPVTVDFIPGITRATEELSSDVGLRASPFVGAGVAISTGDDGDVDFLATGGVDVPIADRFTATAQVNVTLFDDPAVGLLLGVGYNF